MQKIRGAPMHLPVIRSRLNALTEGGRQRVVAEHAMDGVL